jgi:hypothetical protein
MLQKDQHLRPTIEVLWRHPLFQNLKELVNPPEPIINPTPRLAFQSVRSVPAKNTKELLIENGICLKKNIYELTEFAEVPVSQEEEDFEEKIINYQEKQLFYTYKHIYIIQNDFKDVKKIPKFDKNETVAILIPETVKEIPKFYFFFFMNLETFHIFADIEIMREDCLGNCEKLKEVLLPENLKKIGQSCFMICTSLSQINIPARVIEIGKWCFYETNLFVKREIVIEKGGNFTLKQIMKLSEWNENIKEFNE